MRDFQSCSTQPTYDERHCIDDAFLLTLNFMAHADGTATLFAKLNGTKPLAGLRSAWMSRAVRRACDCALRAELRHSGLPEILPGTCLQRAIRVARCASVTELGTSHTPVAFDSTNGIV